MVGKQTIADRTRAKKLSNFGNAEKKSPKKGGTTSYASNGGRKGTRTRSRESDDSDVVVLSYSSMEPETDDGIEILSEKKVEINDESKKGKKNGEKSRATKKGVGKQNGVKIKEAKGSLEKKEMNDASRRRSEGKKEDKKKHKKEEELLVGEETIKQRIESKKHDKKAKRKEVEAKSPEMPNKKDDKKMNVDGDKGRTGKRKNEVGKEDKRNEKRQKINLVEVEAQNKAKNKRRDEGHKEDKNQKTKAVDDGKQRKRQDEDKKDSKPQKKEVAKAEKQMNETKKMQNEGAKKLKKQENKKQKKKVEEVQEQRSDAGQQGRQGKKEEKKDQKKKKKEVEDEEENDKINNALYKFPMSRISRIIKSADINNKIAQEAVFVINKASEKFLELFCREAYASAFLDHKNHVAYNHLSSVVSKRRRLDFLSDFVPEKVKGEAALVVMSEMLKAETETETET